MSSRLRSYFSDQSWYPSTALISWAVMRKLFPAFLTLPSSTVFTFSRLPTSRISSDDDLNLKDDVLEATCRLGKHARLLISSSARPSQKYSWSLSGLISRNGRT